MATPSLKPGSTLTTPINLEESRAQRLQRQQSRFRDRGGIFVPSDHNILADILLGKASPLKKPRRSASATPIREGNGKDKKRDSQGAGKASELHPDLRRSPRKQIRKSVVEATPTPDPSRGRSAGVSLKTRTSSAGPKQSPQKPVKGTVTKPVKPVVPTVAQSSSFYDDGSESEYLPESKSTIQRKRGSSKPKATTSKVKISSGKTNSNKKTRDKKRADPKHDSADTETDEAPPIQVSSAPKHKATSKASGSMVSKRGATSAGSSSTSARSRSKVLKEGEEFDDEDGAPTRTMKSTSHTSRSSSNKPRQKSSAPSKQKKTFGELEDIPEEEEGESPLIRDTKVREAKSPKATKAETLALQKKRPRADDVDPVPDSPEPSPKRARSKKSRADELPLSSKRSKPTTTDGACKEVTQAPKKKASSSGEAASKKRQREPEDDEEYTDIACSKPSTKRKKASPGDSKAKHKTNILDEAADDTFAKSKPKLKPAAAKKAAPMRKRKENSATKPKVTASAATASKLPHPPKGPPKSVLLRLQNPTRNVADNEPDPIDFLS